MRSRMGISLSGCAAANNGNTKCVRKKDKTYARLNSTWSAAPCTAKMEGCFLFLISKSGILSYCEYLPDHAANRFFGYKK